MYIVYANMAWEISRDSWTIEVEKEDILPFIDLNLCRHAYKTTARKGCHTLKYSKFLSNRPQVEQLGINY